MIVLGNPFFLLCVHLGGVLVCFICLLLLRFGVCFAYVVVVVVGLNVCVLVCVFLCVFGLRTHRPTTCLSPHPPIFFVLVLSCLCYDWFG